MEITKDNYFSAEANKEYMSASQFKDFLSCEARALARTFNLYDEEPTIPLLVGSYVDAYFSGDLDIFREDHPELFKKNGELKSSFVQAEEIIGRAERDPVFLDAISGESQKIMTAELFGHKFKIKMDSYHPGERIVDLKVMKDMKRVYKNSEWRSFIDAWAYDVQGYIYQQVVKAVTGEELPFYLAVITKEKPADLELIHIPQWKLNSSAALVEHYTERFVAIKEGREEPKRCGVCAYCRETKKLAGPIEYEELIDVDL